MLNRLRLWIIVRENKFWRWGQKQTFFGFRNGTIVIFSVAMFGILVMVLFSGCSSVEKYLPNTAKEAESSGEDVRKAADKKGARSIKAGKKDLIHGIEKL